MKRIEVPYSKSMLNRVLMLAAVSNKEVQINGTSSSTDIRTMLSALTDLGFGVLSQAGRLTIYPLQKNPDSSCIRVTDSATGFRFILAFLASFENGYFLLDASDQLQKRPMQPLLKILSQMGAVIDSETFPYKISGKLLNGGIYDIDTSISSQFVSAILLSAPLFRSNVTLKLSEEKVSWNYARMTISLMRKAGYVIEERENMIKIRAPQRIDSLPEFDIEPDYSAMAVFWAIATIQDIELVISETWKESMQPDAEFIRILLEMGAEIKVDKDQPYLTCKKLHGIEVDMSQMPDQVPNLAVTALFADSPTVIHGCGHLKYKESDRISALIQELEKIQADISYDSGTLYITPLKRFPMFARFETHDDHRIAIALSIIKAVNPDVIINNKEVVKKSFPDFWKQFDIIRK